MLEDQKRASVAITGTFTATEVVRVITVVMTGDTYLHHDDADRKFHGKIVVELAEVLEDAAPEPPAPPKEDYVRTNSGGGYEVLAQPVP